MEILKIDNIVKAYGENHVLKGANLSFNKGNIYTLIGGNGVGKTTLFNLITGFIKADKGKIFYKKNPIHNENATKINQLGITRTFQDLRLINELSVRENIMLAFKNNPGESIINAFLPAHFLKKQYKGFKVRANEILDKVHLLHLANQSAGEISYGQQKLLSIGCCIANNADLLLLDEPIAGIDNVNYKRISNLLMDIKQEGKTIIQIEHNQNFIKEVSDGVFFLREGNATFFETYDHFINSKSALNNYIN